MAGLVAYSAAVLTLILQILLVVTSLILIGLILLVWVNPLGETEE